MSIKVDRISKFYGSQQALKEVSFSIEKGEIVGFLGPNGAGKSTLMKILTTTNPPSSGSAEVNGHVVTEAPKAVQQSVGYLPEHNPLYTEMYVREYLAFQAAIYKVPKSRIEAIIELTGLSPEAHKKIEQLSKGYRQRVGLAQALLHDPEVLILDEPTTGLDPGQLQEIRDLIKSTAGEKTILLSTHIMQEVEAICDRVIIINRGEIVMDSPIAALNESDVQLIEVEFDYRVETVALSKLPEVQQVVNPSGFVYQLTFNTSQDMRSEVFDFAQKNGLKILQLHKKSRSLEKLFLELTGATEK